MKPTFSRFAPDPAGGFQPSTDTPADAFTTDDQTELDHPYFVSDDESILAGVWECAPSRVVFESYPVHEMITVLSGSVTLTHLDNDRADDGTTETFTSGDTFFIAKGSRLVWEITETVRKYYFISE